MTRDELAAAALTGLLHIADTAMRHDYPRVKADSMYDRVAVAAYAIADAMIKARGNDDIGPSPSAKVRRRYPDRGYVRGKG